MQVTKSISSKQAARIVERYMEASGEEGVVSRATLWRWKRRNVKLTRSTQEWLRQIEGEL